MADVEGSRYTVSMTDPPEQRLAHSTRFFARLQSFDLECPRCGTVYQIRLGPSPKKGRVTPNAQKNWDPTTGRFTCTTRECARTYVLGILAWPITPSPNVASTPPADQVPSPRQLAQMRREGGGWWMADQDGQRYPRPYETNLTTEDQRLNQEEDPDDTDE